MSSIREHTISVLGDGGVGKSSLTIRFITDDFIDEYDPTMYVYNIILYNIVYYYNL